MLLAESILKVLIFERYTTINMLFIVYHPKLMKTRKPKLSENNVAMYENKFSSRAYPYDFSDFPLVRLLESWRDVWHKRVLYVSATFN